MRFFSWIIDLLRHPDAYITWLGYPGLALIVFLETGAMVFFLPGDSLLVVAGLYAAKGDLSLVVLNLLLIPAAIFGDATSYWIGKSSGQILFNRPRSRFYRPEHVAAAQRFYDRHGGKAIILARFMPLVRTFVPVVAGVAKMPYRRFALYNMTGAALWVASMTVIGFVAGSRIPKLGQHIEKVILVVVFLSILPGLIAWWKSRNAKRAAPVPAPAPTPDHDA